MKHHCERPLEQDHWGSRASAKTAGWTPHRHRQITSRSVQESPHFRPSRALVSLVTNIKAEIHNLNAAVAALKSARGQETTDDAGVTPSQPAPPFRPSKALISLVTNIKAEIHNLNAAVAALKSARGHEAHETTDDAGVAPSQPAPLPRSGSPGAALPTIPEETTLFEKVPDAPDGRTAHYAPAWDHCESDLSSAETPVAGARTANKDRHREAPRSAARGRLTLKATADHRRSMRAVCSIEHRMLTLSIDPRNASGEGSQGSSRVVVEVPVEELVVRFQQGRADMFTIAALHEQKVTKQKTNAEICCFANDQAERDEWIAVFRRAGVALFHCSKSESSDAASGAPACTRNRDSPPALTTSAHQADTGCCFDARRHAWRQTSNFHKAFRTFNPESSDAASGAPACTQISPPALKTSAHQADTGCFYARRHAWRQSSNFHKAFRTFNPES